MRFEDIIYKLTDKAIIPEVMGIVSTDLYDWTIFNRYEDSIPEIDKIMEICKSFNKEDEFKNVIYNEEVPSGFYKKYVHFFIIETPEDTDITFFPIVNGNQRYWINGKLAFIGHECTVYTARINKGYNIFCIEYCIEFFYRSMPIVRIERTDKPDNSILSLTRDNYWYQSSDFIIEYKKEGIIENKFFEFALIPCDLIHLNYELKVRMVIRIEENGPILYEMEVSFKEAYKLDLSSIPNMDEDKYERLFVYFTVVDINGKLVEKRIIIYRYKTDSVYTKKLQLEASAILYKNSIPELVKNQINYCIKQMNSDINESTPIEEEVYYGRSLKNIIATEKEKDFNDYLYKPGPHYIYYHSDEDDNYYYYYVVLPRNFDPSKEYPLLLTFTHGNVDHFSDIQVTANYSAHFAEREDAIFADIGGRGCTIGSYMGEIFLLNEIKHLIEHFPINKKRIYAIANCAGNTALFNLAQAYPHLFAGLYTRWSTIYQPSIKNLYNIPCIHLMTTINEKNLLNFNRKKIEKELRRFKFIFVHKYYNANRELRQTQYTKAAIDLLMSQELDEFPEIIYYRTERNRSRRAYYVEITSIQTGKSFAEFSCEIIAYNLVIKTKNCSGLKITLPPQIDRESFIIRINKKTLAFKKYYKNEVFLEFHTKKGFEVVNEICEDICYYKGTGLLDVYLSPMRIINCNQESGTLKEISNMFAHPQMNTSIPYIAVNYPIKFSKDIINNTDYALTVIDNNCNANSELNYIRNQLPIQMDNDGYSYKGNTIKGRYCIMQIIANPWNKEKSVLYINTNDIQLYYKNLFTRKVTIPTYGNGFHPYLNGVALLFDGRKYYSVKEWGEDFAKPK